MRLGPIWFEFNRLPEGFKRVLIFVSGAIGNAEIEVGIRIVCFQCQRFLKRVSGFAIFVQTEIGRPEVVVNNRILRRVLQRILISLNRFGKLPEIVIRIALVFESFALIVI